MDKTAVYADITKFDDRDDGTLTVEGRVSDETLDVDQQIADNTWLKSALPAWFQTGGNIREMHQPKAAGIATEYEETDGGHHIVAHVVDAESVKKVKAGVLRGFSIGIKGPRVVHDKAAQGGRIVGGQVVEVSLVDRPANPSCTLTLAKSAAPGEQMDPAVFDEPTGLVKCEDLRDSQAEPPAGGPEPAADGGGDPGDPAQLLKRDFNAEERRQAAKKQQAMPGGGFPVVTVDDLRNAIRAIGRAKDPAAARAHIKARAKALGHSELIPESWKTVTPDEHPHDPALLAEIRNGLLQCLIAEAQEAMTGEDETADLQCLVQTLGMFLYWWEHEEQMGEVPGSETTKATIADSKFATADTVKSVVAEAVERVTSGLVETVDRLTARLETVEKMAAPGGPSRTRTKAAQIQSHAADQLRTEIAQLTVSKNTVGDHALEVAYGRLIAEKTLALDKLASPLT